MVLHYNYGRIPLLVRSSVPSLCLLEHPIYLMVGVVDTVSTIRRTTFSIAYERVAIGEALGNE